MTEDPASPGAGEDVDGPIVAAQLGRAPRGSWSVACRCRWARPVVISVAPHLDDGQRFPTALWLTCPVLSRLVDDAESVGGTAEWSARVAADPALAQRMLDSDARYRAMRAALAEGVDPCAGVGVAGQTDPLAVKCLHARVAAFLGGAGDPVGEAFVADLHARSVETECDDDRCRVHGG